MWPNLLELTKDDCRGILRRSELEAYSQVISTFRAQGSLNEKKSKILKELREIFHINEDRHKAEIRRATNDEELCTIAEKIAGPNTGQEWCLEGRRRYPLIPRDPSLHTALSVIANAAIKDVLSTAPISDHLKEEPRQNLPISASPVITEDPFSIVNANKVEMKLLKSPKKRSIEKDLPSPPFHTNTHMRIQQLYHSHSVGIGRTPTKQRKFQSKRQLSIKGKVPVNKPTHKRKLATVPSVPGGLTEHKPRQKKSHPPKATTENLLTSSDAGWGNEIIEATTGPPVQIVYTTPNQTFTMQKDDAQNNLIAESTSITWLNNAAGPTIQNNRLQTKPIIGKNSHLIIGDNSVTNANGPRRNFGVNIIEDITLDQLCNIEKSPHVSSSTHLLSDQTVSLPNNNSFSTSTGIIQTNLIGPTKPPKIQITNQQILSNKIPIIKSLQSKGNVTLINKDGRMVIKTPTDPSSGQKTVKSESKMDQLIKAASLTSSPNSSTNQQNSNKISLQKLQLVMPNKVRAATNMVKIFTSPQQLQGTPLKEKIVLPVTQKPSDIVSLSGQENVVVLSVCQTDNTNINSINVTDSMIDKNIHVITEDTPIDIISSDEIGKFDKQNNVPLKSTQLLRHLKSPVVKTVDGRSRAMKGTPKSLKTIVVTDTIDVSDDNDVVSSTDWEVELDHANNCKTQEMEQDNPVELSNVVEEDGQSDPIESYLQRIDDETDDIIQYDGCMECVVKSIQKADAQ